MFTNARPALKDKDAKIADYDYIFIGCPVWWQTAIQKICDLTPNSKHLNGLGASSGSTSGVESWLKSIGIIQ